jgi:hypothetical protein
MIDAAIEKVKKEGAKFPQHSKFTSRPKTFLKAFYEEIVKKLHGEGYIDARIESITVGGGNRSYTTYNLTAKARQVLSSPSSTICLPVPEKLREEERQEERRRAAEVKELKDCGIDTAFLAQEDENVAETSLQDSLNWIRMLKRYRESGREAMVDAKEELLDRIMQWRQRTAVELSMAPEGLLKKSLALRIAYSQAATVESLEAVGLRVNGVDRLAAIISESVVELGLRQDGRISLGADDSASLTSDNDIMVFASGPIRIDSSKMKSAATSAGKITAAPAWKVSYEKFAAGSSIETIAMSNTKAILVATVIGHLTEAYLNGCAVDWNRLSAEASRAAVPFPTKVICAKLETAAALLGMDPATSELNATAVLQVEKHCIRSKSVLNQALTKYLITIKEYTGSAGCIFT